MSKIHLLDTNTITYLTQGNVAAWQHWAKLSKDDEVLTCFAVVGEWEYGILNAPGLKTKRETREQGEQIFDSLDLIVESSPEVNLAYGQIASELRRADSAKRCVDSGRSARYRRNRCYA